MAEVSMECNTNGSGSEVPKDSTKGTKRKSAFAMFLDDLLKTKKCAKTTEIPPACQTWRLYTGPLDCKVCEKTLPSVDSYLSHGKAHQFSTNKCAFCGEVMYSESVLIMHLMERRNYCKNCDTLVTPSHECPDHPDTVPEGTQPESSAETFDCPLDCGLKKSDQHSVEAHLIAFHGCSKHDIKFGKSQDDKVSILVEAPADCAICPKCQTKISKSGVGLNNHLAFFCYARSAVVRKKIMSLQHLSRESEMDAFLLLEMDIESLMGHLKGLLEKGPYWKTFIQDSIGADRRYSYLDNGFSTDVLAFIPDGYSLPVLLKETNNFPVVFDIWSKVAEQWAGPKCSLETNMKMEALVQENIMNGELPKWKPLPIDPELAKTPDAEVLADLERQLGWQ